MYATSLGGDTLTKTVIPPSQALALDIARAASSKKATDIKLLEVRALIAITDYFVICSGATDRHVRTIVAEIERELSSQGVKPARREGERDMRWVLLDYVDVVVHVFAQEERDFYELERLWRDAPMLDFEDEPAAQAGN